MNMSALIFGLGIVISFCFAAGAGVRIMRENKYIDGTFNAAGVFLLILTIGIVISLAGGNFFKAGEPPANTVSVTVTPEAR